MFNTRMAAHPRFRMPARKLQTLRASGELNGISGRDRTALCSVLPQVGVAVAMGMTFAFGGVSPASARPRHRKATIMQPVRQTPPQPHSYYPENVPGGEQKVATPADVARQIAVISSPTLSGHVNGMNIMVRIAE